MTTHHTSELLCSLGKRTIDSEGDTTWRFPFHHTFPYASDTCINVSAFLCPAFIRRSCCYPDGRGCSLPVFLFPAYFLKHHQTPHTSCTPDRSCFILDLTRQHLRCLPVGTSTISSTRTSPLAPTLRTSIAMLLSSNDCYEACCINALGFLLLQRRRSTRLEDSRGHDLVFVTMSAETSLCACQASYIDLLYRREAASAFP